MANTILAIGAHYDDCVFGIPGILLQAARKHQRVVILSVIGDYSNWSPTKGREKAFVDGTVQVSKEYGAEMRYLAYASHRYDVSLETRGGAGFEFHLESKRGAINSRSWDKVVMQGQSTLDLAKPGDATKLIATSRQLADVLRSRNPKVELFLMATWSRADQTYPEKGAWFGKPIEAMARDVRIGNDKAAAGADIKTVIPVAGALILLQGIAEIVRCVVCLKTGEWPSRLHDVAEIDVIEEQLAHSQYVDEESRKIAIEGAQRIDEIARQRGMGGDINT